jgi:hypothetical protein
MERNVSLGFPGHSGNVDACIAGVYSELPALESVVCGGFGYTRYRPPYGPDRLR